jgi:hypothetical protein
MVHIVVDHYKTPPGWRPSTMPDVAETPEFIALQLISNSTLALVWLLHNR